LKNIGSVYFAGKGIDTALKYYHYSLEKNEILGNLK
jgi:hypothetical protein|tara:strand:- start:201 stop:308 length:108 start_codon:yes stop_codon:yes gene_type:complete